MAGLPRSPTHHVKSRCQNPIRESTIAAGDERFTPSQLPPLLVWPAVVGISPKHGRRSARLAYSRADQFAPSARAHRFDLRRAHDCVDFVRRGDRGPCRPQTDHDLLSKRIGTEFPPARDVGRQWLDRVMACHGRCVCVRLRARIRPTEPHGAFTSNGSPGRYRQCRGGRRHDLAAQSTCRPGAGRHADLLDWHRPHLLLLLWRFTHSGGPVAGHQFDESVKRACRRWGAAAHGRGTELHSE